MSFPKRKRRNITVDDIQYHWVPTPMRGFTPPMVALLVCRATDPSGSMLNVRFWQRHVDIIVPGDVQTVIANALKRGWKPDGDAEFYIGPDDAYSLLSLPKWPSSRSY